MTGRQGDREGALALLEEQERICRELGNRVGLQLALALHHQAGALAEDLGRRQEARPLAEGPTA
jgi:hypothetical protein